MVSQFVNFCDRIKRAKDFDTSNLKSCRPEKNDKHQDKNPCRESTKRSNQNNQYCKYQGMCNHTTKECIKYNPNNKERSYRG